MTCPHCETWILDDDHRCRRCGRRVRSGPPLSATGERFPVATDATARDYQYEHSAQTQPVARALKERVAAAPVANADGQQALFGNPNPSRIVAFDTFASTAEKESIRARAAEVARPEPLRQAKVEVRHARPRSKTSADQRMLDFFGSQEVVSPPQSNIICDAPVAPASLRIQATVIDGLVMLAAMGLLLSAFIYLGGTSTLDKHSMPYLIAALMTIPVFYKTMWVYVNRDSFGTEAAGLRLVDFDGNPPTQARRYQRLAGSFISVLAGGMGLVWALADEDALTWHDYMSSTFATLAGE